MIFSSFPQRSENYFVHHFAPAGLSRIPKNVVFMIDQSGSMHGKKIQQVGQSIAAGFLATFHVKTRLPCSIKHCISV